MSETELLERLRQGDEGAFTTLFRRWYAPLVQLADRMLGDRAAAEETVQEVMFELWKRRENLALQSSPQAYLFQSTRNRALNRIRRLRVERREEFDADTLPARSISDDAAREGDLERAVRDAIAALPPRCRQVFELNRVKGLKYAEVAEVLGVSVKAVEAQMGKALKALRERLAPWIEDERLQGD